MANVDTLRALDMRLRRRRELTDLFERYYAGNHRLAYATQKFRDAFGDLFGAFADNWCGVICETPNERLDVQGFQIGDSGTVDEAAARAAKAWKAWQENDMETLAGVIMLGAIKCGVSYALVDVTADPAIVTAWPSSMAIVTYDNKTRKSTEGACFWKNDDGTLGATLYMPDEFVTFQSKDKPKVGQHIRPEDRKWVEVDAMANPRDDGALPLVELVNRPNELNIGSSDLADVVPMQDAINKLVNDMLVASEFQAFRQRVLTGIEVPKDPTTGQPLANQQLEAAISRLWVFENPDAHVWDLPATDLGNYVAGIKELLNHVAAQTRTPPHYLIGAMVNVSGEALTAAESGLVSRVKEKQRTFARGWREVMKLLLDTEDAIEVKWANPERQPLAAIADPVTKLSAPQLGLSREVLWRMLGFSELEIVEMKKSTFNATTQADGSPANPTQATQPQPPPPPPQQPPPPKAP